MSKKKQGVLLGGVFVIGVLGGGALMYNDSVYDSVRDALGQGATQNAVGASGMTSVDISSMDLETALMAVQQQRSQLLDQQLKDQITAVQAKNDQIAKLNNLLAAAYGISGKFGSDAKTGDSIPNDADTQQRMSALNAAAASAGVTVPALANKGQLDGFIQQMKSTIDSMSNSQQMDMLRLQSLSNKQNEAFDVMTNFIKKMQDSRSSIIGNMR